ncbi:metallophosphoesterase family protein [Flavivirga amylovorans]|uniref:Metallophosphoesterase family protein n=1 Tax=Flavivirga amylovorans TaxID=870486 RepID=A0ABT8WZI8_9FLAO|nr:metallophosphoesterase family protein [Flavivirga amylovorans]MDO5987093.1 metallophosphoesterase family protein [Flavivirga amylovorans]
MKRTLVIGDIHGGLKALIQVLERAKVTTDDTLIFLGDYIDGWSESAQTIQYLIELSEKQECIFIKGNHDVWCEDYLRIGKANRTWLFHGGALTFEGYQQLSDEEKKKHLNFFERMKLYYVDDNNNLFIHAGYTSMKGPEQEFYKSNYNWDRTLWEMVLTMDKRVKKHSVLYPKRLKIYNEIYIGHTPTLYYNIETPMNAINVWNIDTGAAFTGKLTVLDVNTKQYWQSDNVNELYPNEKGRN